MEIAGKKIRFRDNRYRKTATKKNISSRIPFTKNKINFLTE
jgi:hypothetical protein